MKLVETFTEQIGDVMELVGGDFAESAAGQFLFNGAQVERATNHLVFGQEAFLKDFEFESAWRLEAGFTLAAPGYEDWFGYAKAGGNASKAEALGAQFDELSFGFGRVHMLVDSGGLIVDREDLMVDGFGRKTVVSSGFYFHGDNFGKPPQQSGFGGVSFFRRIIADPIRHPASEG